MSRQDYGDNESPAAYLWPAVVRRAMASPRGQGVLRELEAAMLALPWRRLCSDRLANEDGDVCALGAVYLHRKTVSGEGDPESAFQELYQYMPNSLHEAAAFGRDDLGIAFSLAWTVADENDLFGKKETPEERWERMLRWVRANLSTGGTQ